MGQATELSERLLDGDRFIRFEQVIELIGDFDPVTVWRWERKGAFPRRIKLGGIAVAWIEREVVEWMRERAGGQSDEVSPPEEDHVYGIA